MIDLATKRPLRVMPGGDAGPYIMLPVEQVDRVRALLDRHGVSYWEDELTVSVDGKPAITVINLRRGTDAAMVQQIVDEAD